mmetsp:Transcript_16229/g.25324  ORF Transcript_16229/g.25324 Transcript_16229/m.25324 type:complete len:1372 (+) Transcript_16229:395-4510(+)
MHAPLSVITLNSSTGVHKGTNSSRCGREGDGMKVRNIKDSSSLYADTSVKTAKRYYSEGRFYGIEQFILLHYRPKCSNESRKKHCNHYCSGRDATEDELNLSFLPIQNADIICISSISDTIKSLDLSHCKYIGDVGVKYLRVLKGLTKLNLSGCSRITDVSCRVLKENLNRLEEVDLSGCNVSDRGIIEVLEGCLYLESISIRNNSSFTDRGLEAIQTNVTLMKLLRSLDFAGCREFSNEGLIRLLENEGGVIRNLDLSRCSQIDLGLIGFRRNHSSTNCRVLKLNGLVGICDSTMAWLAEGCGRLQVLDLSDCCTVSDSSLSYLSQGCNRLKTLTLNRCRKLTDEGLSNFIHTAGHHLQSISLRNCAQVTDKTAFEIGKYCQKLKFLDIFGVPKVSDRGLAKIARCCRWLEEVNFSADINALDSSRTARVPRIGKDGVEALGRYCRELKSIKCRGAVKVETVGVISLSFKCHKLATLSLKYCYQVTNDALIALAKHCHLITDIDLGGCIKISDVGIISLSQGCPDLQNVDLLGLMHITDRCLLALGFGCRKLTRLVLRSCEKVTDAGIVCLIKHCRMLLELDLGNIGGVTDASVNKISSYSLLLRSANFNATEVSLRKVFELDEVLPFASKLPAKLQLRPVQKSIEEFNQYAKYHKHLTLHQTNLSKCLRGFVRRRKFTRLRNEAVMSSIIIQKSFRGYISRRNWRSSRESLSLLYISTLVFTFRYRKMKRIQLAGCQLIQRRVRVFLARIHYQNLKIRERRDKESLKEKLAREREILKKEREREFVKLERGVVHSCATGLVNMIFRHCFSRLKWHYFYGTLLEHYRLKIEVSACLSIQSWWARMLCFVRSRRARDAVIMIQAFGRRFLARLKFLKRFRIYFSSRNHAVIQIQCWWLDKVHWQRIFKQIIGKEQHHRMLYERKLAAKQASIKKWQSLKDKAVSRVIFSEKHFIIKRMFHRRREIVKIQSLWRSYLALLALEDKRKQLQNWKFFFRLVFLRRRVQNAIVIQRSVLHFLWKKERICAVVKIQCAFRTYHSIISFQQMLLNLKNISVQKIQRCFWIYCGRCYRKCMRAALEQSTRMIQKAYRRHQALNTAHYRRRKELAMAICEKEKVKKELVWRRHEQRLRDLFASRDNRAAAAIQRSYRSHLNQVREERKAILLVREEDQKRQTEEDRRNRVIEKKRAKDSLLRSKLRKALETARQIVYWKSERIENDANTGQSHCDHGLGSFTKIKNVSPLKRKNEKVTVDSLKQRKWFNIRLERTMYRFGMDPIDILRLHDTSFAGLDFLGEDSVDVVDFFEFIGEPCSKFSTWLLSCAHLDGKTSINFTEYTNLVALVCLMGRDDLLRLLFCSVDEEKKTFFIERTMD